MQENESEKQEEGRLGFFFFFFVESVMCASDLQTVRLLLHRCHTFELVSFLVFVHYTKGTKKIACQGQSR